MPKFFTNLPVNLEQYNPEAIPKEWRRGKTFDKDGLFHSYDDVPIIIEGGHDPSIGFTLDGSWQKVDEFRWYTHGTLYRAGNKPPVVKITEDSYLTFNEHIELHSYNGMPGSFIAYEEDGSFALDWFHEGAVHRDGDLPLSIVVNSTGVSECEYYGIHGTPHRGNSLPADSTPDSKAWLVQGVMHNSEGYAEILYAETPYPDSCTWALYGLKISEETFKEIRTLHEQTDIPFWVAFLFVLKFISNEHLKAFLNSNGQWDTYVPTSWLISCWKITAILFENKINELAEQGSVERFHNLDDEVDESDFANFLAIVESEDKDALARAAIRERNHA